MKYTRIVFPPLLFFCSDFNVNIISNIAVNFCTWRKWAKELGFAQQKQQQQQQSGNIYLLCECEKEREIERMHFAKTNFRSPFPSKTLWISPVRSYYKKWCCKCNCNCCRNWPQRRNCNKQSGYGIVALFFHSPPFPFASECLSKVPQPLVGRDNADNTLANTKPLDPLPQHHYLLNPLPRVILFHFLWTSTRCVGALQRFWSIGWHRAQWNDQQGHPHTHTERERERERPWHNHNELIRLEHRVATYGCKRQKHSRCHGNKLLCVQSAARGSLNSSWNWSKV